MSKPDPLRSTPEFRAYEQARDAVVRMKQAVTPPASHTDPSEYWTEELANIDYLIDASPLIVRKLRHHAFHITGIRPYDYRSRGDGRQETFTARLEALRALGGDRLLVPESPVLGGFGYAIDHRLFNVDTLKFFEVLIAMDRGGVLAAISGVDRPVVCEIGAGWGGFAYQFKTLFPRSTYVIVDFPELFLFSATYLAVAFPDARLHWCDSAASLDGWQDADFVFVPHTLASLVATLPLDLTVNMVSFQEMTDAQVRGYAAMAADARCPLLYSLNRERSAYNTELVSVSDALASRYHLTEVEVLGSDYAKAMRKPPKPPKAPKPGQPVKTEMPTDRYRHLIGRLTPPAAGDGADDTATKPATADAIGKAADAPSVVLGMTLYNNAAHLREALDSLLAQSWRDFTLLLLDDASGDDTEAIAREYAARDRRIRYQRHASRQAMIATWREVATIAARDVPSARYFAWVSDHDRWHPQWLSRMVETLDADPEAVLAYPITRRVTQAGDETEKGPRLFETAAGADRRARWNHFCAHGVGAGDMVYGLMRIDALLKAGIFRDVLRPDRLLIAELTLYGGIRQVPEVLWFRRESNGTSVERQRKTLLLPGQEPGWFGSPPWFQHALVLWRQYVTAQPPRLPIAPRTWSAMLMRYQLTYGWRHFRKTETSHALGRGVDNVIWARKRTRHHYHHAVYHTLVGGRALWGRTRRLGRQALFEVLTLTHRLGLRGRGQTPSR